MSETIDNPERLIILQDESFYGGPNVEEALALFRTLSDAETREAYGFEPEFERNSSAHIDALAQLACDYALVQISESMTVGLLDSMPEHIVYEPLEGDDTAYVSPVELVIGESDIVDESREELHGPLELAPQDHQLVYDMLQHRREALANLAVQRDLEERVLYLAEQKLLENIIYQVPVLAGSAA